MKKITIIFLLQLITIAYGYSQKFALDTLHYAGDPDKYINFVMLGDGYTKTQQDLFYANAVTLSNYLFEQEPWSHYVNYFNVFAIKVISKKSGIGHPKTAMDCGSADRRVPYSNPNTYFDCTFDSYGIHRLVVANDTNAVNAVLADNFPDYDQVFIIANSPYYGGSGGKFAVATTEESSNEIAAHEIGHSFAGLADEYWAGDVYAEEKCNLTAETDPRFVKWKNWIGVDSVGIYQHCCGESSADWYKPHQNCKMEVLGSPYCPVCKEAIIEKIHSLVNPIVKYTPIELNIHTSDALINFTLTELMRPVPNTLSIEWKIDEDVIGRDIENISIDPAVLSKGRHTVQVVVTDINEMLRIDNHAEIHSSSVIWTIYKE